MSTYSISSFSRKRESILVYHLDPRFREDDEKMIITLDFKLTHLITISMT